jgi:putative membrane protein
MILLHWLITTLVVFILPHFISGIGVDSLTTALIVAAVLVFLNMVVEPIVKLLTLPLNILTLGLFSLGINAGFFWIVTRVVPGFTVATITAAIIGALVISIANWVISRFLKHG